MAVLGRADAGRGPNLPHSVVRGLVQEADLLVAGEAGEGERRDGLRGEEEGLVADELVGLDANFLAVPDHVVVGGARSVGSTAHEVDNRAGTGANSLLGGGHSVCLVVASDPVAHVADEPAVGPGALEHDGITEVERLILAVRVRNL